MTEKLGEAKALELKNEGNILFKIKNYEAAIEKYDEALVKIHLPRPIAVLLVFYTPIRPDAIVS